MRIGVSVVSICLCSTVAAQQGWLPPETEGVLTKQLATRVAEIGVGRTDETRLAAARQLVSRIGERLESWGEAAIEHAPRLEELDLPESGNQSLDAMARYQMCNLVLMIQLQDPDFANDEEAKMTSVAGLTAFTLTLMYLRHPFVMAGGNDGEIEAFLTSEELEAVFEAIQDEPAARAHTESQCAPPLKALIEPSDR